MHAFLIPSLPAENEELKKGKRKEKQLLFFRLQLLLGSFGFLLSLDYPPVECACLAVPKPLSCLIAQAATVSITL